MLVNVQLLRFLAAILVLLHHSAAHLAAAGHAPGALFEFGKMVGFAGVDIFFVISGFIMQWTSREESGSGDALAFLKRRVARIYSGYWPFFLLAVAMFWAVRPERLATADLLRSVLLWPAKPDVLLIPVSWTLIYEMGFYLLFTIVIAATGQRRIAVFRTVIVITGFWWLFSQFYRQAYAPGALESMNVFELYLAFPFLLEFLGGVMLAEWLHKRPDGPGLTLLAGGAVLLALGAWFNLHYLEGRLIQGYHISWRILILGTAAMLIVAGAVRLESAGHVFSARPSILLGGASYALYLSHTLILFTLYAYGLHAFLGTFPVTQAQALMILICGLIVVVSVVHYRLIERPLHHGFRKWLRV